MQGMPDVLQKESMVGAIGNREQQFLFVADLLFGMQDRLEKLERKIDELSELGKKTHDILADLSTELDHLGQRLVDLVTRLAAAETLEEAQSNITTIAQMVSRVRTLGATQADPVPGGPIPPTQPLPDTVPDDMA